MSKDGNVSAARASRKFAAYPRLNPLGIGRNISAADLIDSAFLAYNGGRLREAAKLLVEKMLPEDGYIGLSLTGALTPAGLGKSCLIPLMKAGFVDWIVSTAQGRTRGAGDLWCSQELRVRRSQTATRLRFRS